MFLGGSSNSVLFQVFVSLPVRRTDTRPDGFFFFLLRCSGSSRRHRGCCGALLAAPWRLRRELEWESFRTLCPPPPAQTGAGAASSTGPKGFGGAFGFRLSPQSSSLCLTLLFCGGGELWALSSIRGVLSLAPGAVW